MKYEEIIKLLDAGYTREEIIEMGKEPEEKKPEDPKPKDPKPEEKHDDDSSEMNNLVEEMRKAFAELKKEITAFNIMASRQPEIEEKSSEDIIANIINPTRKKKGE